jgi:hypothetical protein
LIEKDKSYRQGKAYVRNSRFAVADNGWIHLALDRKEGSNVIEIETSLVVLLQRLLADTSAFAASR